jgi:hypothetical protein
MLTKKKKAALEEIWQGLCELKNDPRYPEIIKALAVYVKVLKAAEEGRLSPEQLEKLNEINEMVRRTHQQHFGE